ncbi:MAG TPA: WbuC family cupin fold metalloprotein [Candidatus Binatia bacterium]|nr:WbuC family cupin fold metalloprotein [Candidatus Binatia bacterium]
MTLQRITGELLAQLDRQAQASPRLRTHHNLHEGPQAAIQRLAVKLRRGTYIRPHRHPQKWELGVVLQGRMDLLLFDDAGTLTERTTMTPMVGVLAVELPARTWHSYVCVSDAATFFEVKEGPYDPATSGEFAPWAPPEGDAQAAAYLDWMGSAPVGARFG